RPRQWSCRSTSSCVFSPPSRSTRWAQRSRTTSFRASPHQTNSAQRLCGALDSGSSSCTTEEQPLAKAPQRRCPEFVWCGLALNDVVREPWAHLVEREVGEQTHRLVAQRFDRRVARRQSRRVALRTPNGAEQGAS